MAPLDPLLEALGPHVPYQSLGHGLLGNGQWSSEKKGASDKSLSSVKPAVAKPEEGQQETMRSAQAKAARLRSQGPNMLYVAMLVLLHPQVFRKGFLVYCALNKMSIFHGLQVKECETVTGNLAWYSRMALGAF